MCKYNLTESVTCRCFSLAAQSSLQKLPWDLTSISFASCAFRFCWVHTMKNRQTRKRRGKTERKKKMNKWSLHSPLGILCTGKNHLFTAVRLANKIDKIHHVYCIICVNKMNSTVPTWWMRSSCLACVIFSAFSILLCSSVWITSSSFTSFPVFMFPSLATATGASWENSKRL